MSAIESEISNTTAKDILATHYGIVGTATPLPGEVDLNFKITTSEGPSYILKLSKNSSEEFLNFQNALLHHLEQSSESILTPTIIRNTSNDAVCHIVDDNGQHVKVRLLTWISGRLWSQVNPHLDTLRYSLGQQLGHLTHLLSDFDHDVAHRDFEWDIAQSLWTKNHIELFNSEQAAIVSYFIQLFESRSNSYNQLRKGMVHNDANDNNIVVSMDLMHPLVKAIIDFGDAIHTQIINDVAVACAYAIMHHNDPLEASLPIVKGYHDVFSLQPTELEHLYAVIGMRLVISVTKSAINKEAHPENTYLQISEQPAWELLKKWKQLSADFAHFSFRKICGYSAHPDYQSFQLWAKNQNFQIASLFPTIGRSQLHHLDLSVSSTWVGHQSNFNDLDLFQFKIDRLQKEHCDKIIAGGYCEPRALYTSSAFDKIGNQGRESRTVHIGVDFWLPAQTPVHALFDGEIVTAVNDDGDKEYGGLIILKHVEDAIEFYTLYGHLSVESALQRSVGETIAKGDIIGKLGPYPENGNWAPHLHFQIMLSMLDYTIDFPGVAYYNQIEVWKELCPDPNSLFKSEALKTRSPRTNDVLIQDRDTYLGKSLSLQYKQPIKIVRGSGVYLMDQNGRKYLDTVNNVAHVGHEHPDVVRAGQEQMALLNTNSRYLHENITLLAKALTDTLPSSLEVVHFVNSGSEANELAIRMAKAVTGQRDIIASEVGYHGNSNLCVDISSYKFDGKGGHGKPEYTEIFPLPDSFRGKYRGPDVTDKYIKEVGFCLQRIQEKGRNIAAMIVEPIISCGGQIEFPQGFLKEAYKLIRHAGGVCISDEVQTGCGRMGQTFWGFQLHDVVPDIVTIGKPLGNGHPVAAVVCTRHVAEKFANGMEYFNTFGGNPVSCAIAKEVLKVIESENLQDNALKVGDFLKKKLTLLSKEFPIIADVRGQGLFLGIELTTRSLKPLADQTEYVINRMKDHGILMSSDGPDHNVIKIKPPMVFSTEDAEEVCHYLRKILKEDFMTSYHEHNN